MRQPHVRHMGLKRPPEMFVSTAATNAASAATGRKRAGVQLYLHRSYRALHAAGSDPVWPMYCFDELKAQFESLGSAVQISTELKDTASPVVLLTPGVFDNEAFCNELVRFLEERPSLRSTTKTHAIANSEMETEEEADSAAMWWPINKPDKASDSFTRRSSRRDSDADDATAAAAAGAEGAGGAGGAGGAACLAAGKLKGAVRRLNEGREEGLDLSHWLMLRSALGQLNRAGVEALAEPTRAQNIAQDKCTELAEMMVRDSSSARSAGIQLDAPPAAAEEETEGGGGGGGRVVKLEPIDRPSGGSAPRRTRVQPPSESDAGRRPNDEASSTIQTPPTLQPRRKSCSAARRLSMMPKMPTGGVRSPWGANKRNGINGLFSWGRTKRTSERASEPPPLVPLYSTQVPFFEYIDACPQRLKDLGLFEFVRFDKWPHTAELQPTATAVALVRLQREKERRTEVALQEEKRSLYGERPGSMRNMLGAGFPRVQPHS